MGWLFDGIWCARDGVRDSRTDAVLIIRVSGDIDYDNENIILQSK